MKGYLTAIEAKLLQPVNETFCSVSTSSTNYCYLDRLSSWELVVQRKLAKGRSSDGGPAASLMIKSAKICRGRRQ